MESRSRALSAFFILTLLLSWIAWLPTTLGSRGWADIDLSLPVSALIGAFGPTLAALIIVALYRGKSGLGQLLRPLFIWRVPIGWYLFALFWPPLLTAAAGLLATLFGSPIPDYGTPPVLNLYPLPPELTAVGPWPLLPFIFLQNMLVGSAMGEEIGWRGFALPRLQSRLSALSASLLLGLLWGLWHLPLYLTEGHPLSDVFFGWTLIGILADAILFTWVFNNTRGSLLLALLFHASIATAALFVSSSSTAIIFELILKWGLVAALLLPAASLLPDLAPQPQDATDAERHELHRPDAIA